MDLNNIAASTVSLSFQYTAMQLSSTSQSGGTQSGNLLPVMAETEGGRRHDEGHGQFQGFMQSVQMTFSQLGLNLFAQQGGAANDSNAAPASEISAQSPVADGTGNDAALNGNDIRQTLHAFMHALFHALKSLGGEGGGEHEHDGDRDDNATYAPSGSASYSSISVSLSLLVNNLDSGVTPATTDSSVNPTDTTGATPDSTNNLPAAGNTPSYLAAAGNGDSQNNIVSMLQSAFENLLNTLGGNSSSSGSQTSLKDFLKELQTNVDGNSQQQQFSFSMSLTAGSIVYTHA
jgi:hypothetical protein